MRAPDYSFTDAIDAFLQRHNLPALPGEAMFFARLRQCPGIPRARRATDYYNLANSLSIAWEVANVWPESAEIARRKRDHAARQLEAIRMMRKDEVPFPPEAKYYLDRLEHRYTAQVNEFELEEIMMLEYVRRDHLRVAELGREHRGAGQKLFAREVSLAMRDIFGKPHNKTVGILTGLAFETRALGTETVRAMCKGTGVTRLE
jgi:hypothetical protein